MVNLLWSNKSVSCPSLLISGLFALCPLNSIASLTDFIDIASFSSTATTLNTYTFNQFNNDVQLSSSPINFDNFSVSINVRNGVTGSLGDPATLKLVDQEESS